MKHKRILAFLLTLAMLFGALPLYVLGAFEAPAIEKVEEKLTETNEGLVFDTDFENAVLSPDGKTGTANSAAILSGAVMTKGTYLSALTLRDFWINDGYQNLYTDGHSIIWRAHDKAFSAASNDDNNNIEISVKNPPIGQDFVISFDMTMRADRFSADFPCFARCTTASSAFNTTFLTFAKDGSVKAGSTVITKLAKGDSHNFTTHIKMTDPTDEYPNGAILYDVYMDGVLAAENIRLVSEAQQATIKSASGTVTGLASDYKLTYVRLFHVNGKIQAADANGKSLGANGADIISMDSLRMYYSDTCYEVTSTVDEVSLAYGTGGYELTYRLNLDEGFASTAGSKIRFTSPSGKVTEAPVGEKDADGLYSLTFTVETKDYAGDCKLELIDKDGASVAMTENGKPAESYNTSVKALETDLYNFTAAVMPVYGAAKGIASLTFDDAVYPSALVVEELCEKYGMQASMMMWCSRIGASGSDYADAKTWSELFAKGYLEPQNHSTSHMDLRSNTEAGQANQSAENFQNQIVDSKLMLEELFPDYDIITYAMPYGSMSAEAKTLALQYHYVLRGVSSGGLQSLSPGFGHGNGTWGSLYSPAVVFKENGVAVSEEVQIQKLKAWIDRTVNEGGWYAPFIHKVGDVSGTEMSYNVISQLFAYMDTYQESGDLWVTTFSNATKYVRERQNTSASVRFEGGNVYLTLTMTDKTADGLPLPLDVFNHPLTVKVEVPETFKSVAYKIGGEYKTVSTFTEGDATYAYIDAIPNGEDVEIRGVHSFKIYEKIDENSHKKICECGYFVTETHEKNEFGFCEKCELSITGVSLAISEDLILKYHINVYDSSYLGKLSMSFTMDGAEFTVTDCTEKDGVCIFSFDGIGPHQVGKKVNATLMANGTPADSKNDFSIEEYCKEAMALNSEDKELVDLINDLLIYARAAEKYILGTQTIAAGISLTPSEYAPNENDNALKLEGNENSELYIYAAGVRFDSVNKIYFKINSSSESFSLKLTDPTGALTEYSSSELSVKDSCYIVYSDAILATGFAEEYKIELLDENGASVSKLTYTVNTYTHYTTQNSESDEMKALALALYRYGKSCEVYSEKNP